MSVFKDILQEERKRLNALKNKYEQALKKLPKGSLSRKVRNNKSYYYLAHREGDKVKFEYVGKADSEKYRILQKELSKRHEVLNKLKQVNKELRELSKTSHEE